MPRLPFAKITTDPRRRRMLAAGLLAAAATGGGVALLGRDRGPPLPPMQLKSLRPSEVALWMALLPVILGSRLPEREPGRGTALRAAITELDRMLSNLPRVRQQQLSELSATLAAPVPRIMLAGSWRSWERASGGEIRAFLYRWQHSPLVRLNLAYRTLVETAHLAWYAEPAHQQPTGYPGPPMRIRPHLASHRQTGVPA